MKPMLAPPKTLIDLHADIIASVIAYDRAKRAALKYVHPASLARAQARIGHLQAQFLNAVKIRDAMLRKPKAVKMLFLAKIQGRRRGAIGRFYPVDIEFEALTVDGDIRQATLFECAIDAADKNGYEVDRVETVSGIRMLEG